MAVHYRKLYFKSRDRENVSRQWFVLLYVLHRAGIRFNVNEGHRTMYRQWQLVRQYGLWSPSNPTGAARPTPWAPHIRTGRPNHAIDFDNAGAVVAAAAVRDVRLYRPIPQEPWHVEPDANSLRRFYNKHRRQVFRQIRKNKREARRKNKKHRRRKK